MTLRRQGRPRYRRAASQPPGLYGTAWVRIMPHLRPRTPRPPRQTSVTYTVLNPPTRKAG